MKYLLISRVCLALQKFPSLGRDTLLELRLFLLRQINENARSIIKKKIINDMAILRGALYDLEILSSSVYC